MKVYIGPYSNYITPYKVVSKLKYFGVSDNVVDFLERSLSRFWPYSWFDNRKRKISVKIDNYDIWNADHTLALIILPILKEMRNDKCGAPYVNNEDVPVELQTNISYHDEEYGKTRNRWNYILDKMIWSFDQIATDKYDIVNFNSNDEYFENLEEVRKGLQLFGKYYLAMWI